MRIIFCDSGFSPKEVDYLYQEEYNAAKRLQISVSLISFEAIKKNNLEQATQKVPTSSVIEEAIYRGWMLSEDLYNKLYTTLLAKNIKLINSPQAYTFCHYLPNNYETIKAYTPRSIYGLLEGNFNIDNYKEALKIFGSKPIIVKDYVKSQKHYWEEACYIPDASNHKVVEQVTKRFIELQDVDLNKGIVYREFVQLQQLTQHSISKMPLTKEFRIFVKNKKVVGHFNYWDEGNYGEKRERPSFLNKVIDAIPSNFFSIDFAQKIDGSWIIVEIGDGQVSGLPDNADKESFYSLLISKA